MSDPANRIQVGTRVWTVIDFTHPDVFLPVMKALGHKRGYSLDAPWLLPLNFVRRSGNGWRRYRHAATGVEIALLNGYSVVLSESKLLAIYGEIRCVVDYVAQQHAAHGRTMFDKTPKGERAATAYNRWAFGLLRDLYKLYDEAHKVEVGS